MTHSPYPDDRATDKSIESGDAGRAIAAHARSTRRGLWTSVVVACEDAVRGYSRRISNAEYVVEGRGAIASESAQG